MKKLSRNKRDSISWAARMDDKYVRIVKPVWATHLIGHARAFSHHGYGATEIIFDQNNPLPLLPMRRIHWNQRNYIELIPNNEVIMLRLKQELPPPWPDAGKPCSPELIKKIKYYESREI